MHPKTFPTLIIAIRYRFQEIRTTFIAIHAMFFYTEIEVGITYISR